MLDLFNTYIFHWLPEKAIWVGGHTLSWDARCSGIYIGFGIGILCHLLVGRKAKNLPPLLILVAATFLFLPLFLDVYAIKWTGRVTSNDVRYLTGLFFGAAFSIYLYPAFIMLTSPRLYDYSAIGSLAKFIAIPTFVLCSFILKSWDNLVAYIMLEGLAFIGFLSLFWMLFLPIFRILAKIFSQKTFANTVLTITLLFLTSCGPSLSTITVNTLKPAAVNLGGVKKIAVMGFDGQGSDVVTNKITAKLVESGRFDVFERAQVVKILNEHEMSMTGLVDEGSAAKIGKMLGAEALIIGVVDAYSVSDERGFIQLPKIKEKGFHYETKEDDKGNKKTEKVIDYEWYKVNGSALIRRGNIGITFKIVNVESGWIIAAKNLSKTWEGMNIIDPDPSHEDVYPTPKERNITLPNSATILNRLTDEIVPQLVNMIVPHYVAEIKTYLTADEQTETARKFMVAGQYRDAIGILEAHLARLEIKPDKNKDELHVVYYDLGLLNEISGGFDKAEEYYKKAIVLKGEGLYIQAIAGVRKAREEQKRLDEQGVVKSNIGR